MLDSRISDLFRIRTRFLRSAHLERDFDDAAAINSYVVTPQAAEYFNRLVSGLAPNSGQRAWRVTGDYGVGKSSFALVLAHLLSGRCKGLPPAIRRSIDQPGLRRPKLFPILVTGSRMAVARAILRAIEQSLEKLHLRGRRPRVYDRVQQLLRIPEAAPISDSVVLQVIEDTSEFVRDSGHAEGLLIILDELGKFLEYAALNPDLQDIYLLQTLAETASRSGSSPFVVVGLLHQGFNAYADRLSESGQREWQKVAGRFEELLFDRPLDQTAALIVDALRVVIERLPTGIVRRSRDDMALAVSLGWYGPARKVVDLASLSPGLYPLHPTVLPVLTRLFARFGQNERSLFSFLLSNEPFGLQGYSDRNPGPQNFYRLHDIYDYARATFGHRLSVQSYRSHWNLIESVVESFHASNVLESNILKTVGILNLIDDQGLLASPEAVELAVASCDDERSTIRQVIETLQSRRVLYFRGAAGGFCLWPHTSVNIENAYAHALKSVPSVARVSHLVADEFDNRPVVARRHYIKTGNLRHFDVRCVALNALEQAVIATNRTQSDGLILVPLCETAEERSAALKFAQSEEAKSEEAVLIAVPKPLEMLQSLVQESQRWSWVIKNTPELIHDRYAAEEVSRQHENARHLLRDRVEDLVGLRTFSDKTELTWFRQGKLIDVQSSRDLLSTISDICDEVFPDAPRIRNELVNRRELSSAAAGARMRLIEGLLTAGTVPFLGMDESKKPPEMSMYLSVLRQGRMHIHHRDGTCEIVEPKRDDDSLNVRPTFDKLRELLRRRSDARVKVSDIFEELRKPPLGLRDGILPLLLAVFSRVHEEELAVYEDGGFVNALTGDVFLRLTKVPESFELQYCQVSGVRAAVFSQLARLLEQDGLKESRQSGVIDVVRPLCLFAAQLPPYVLRTKNLSNSALSVRASLVAAKEPATLLFHDLPTACGFPPFEDSQHVSVNAVKAFVATLKSALDDLRGAYPSLLKNIQNEFCRAFDKPDRSFGEVRTGVSATSELLIVAVHEPRLRGFCLRLADRAMAESEWVQALAGFIVGKAPTAWLDNDYDRFREEFYKLAQLFTRVEAATFDSPKTQTAFSARISVTLRDGSDVARVVHMHKDDEALADKLEDQIRAVFGQSRRIGLVAVSRALLRELSGEANQTAGEPRCSSEDRH